MVFEVRPETVIDAVFPTIAMVPPRVVIVEGVRPY
jgi:hypothetical protein